MGGTTKFTWYRPMDPGDSPAKTEVGVDAGESGASGLGWVGRASTRNAKSRACVNEADAGVGLGSPVATALTVLPKPKAYNTSSSPSLAGLLADTTLPSAWVTDGLQRPAARSANGAKRRSQA